ncbi:MAG: PAS domain S-box protein [Deltaproteobacteria bacterium]|nr:PAS domain S-box protein [Deltaproteobacteria bacterium]
MIGNNIRILLVEDNPGDARLIREMLAEVEGASFEIDWVSQLSTGLEKLGRSEIDLVLLDLGLPDSRGLDTFVKAYSHAPQIPFVVLTGLDDEAVALKAVRQGAQDFLVKGQTDSGLLLRAIRYATERKRIEEKLRLANEELRREIEERRAAELAVEAERQRLYALLDGLPGLVYLKAPDFSLKFANRVFREVCGDWEGKKCYEAISKRETPCENCTYFQVIKTGEPSVKEATYAASNRTYQVYSYPFADVDGASLVLTLGIDISERKEAEREVERLASFPELNPHPVFEVNGEGVITYRNAATTKALEELEVKGDGKLFLPEDYEIILQAVGGTESRKFYREVQIKDAVFEEYIDVIPRFDVARIQAYDITARKHAEEGLRQSQARLAKAQRLARLGNWEWDLQSDEMIWSEEVYRIFGVDPNKAAPSLTMMMESLHPEDEARVRERLKETLAGVKPFNLVSRLIRHDCSVRYVHFQAEVTQDEEGRPGRMLGTAQDITERRIAETRLRDSEERFRAIFEAAAMGIALTGIDGGFLSANKAFQDMIGYRVEELRGKSFQELCHADDRDKNLALFEELTSGQRNHFQMEKRYLRKDGQYFWGRVTVSLVKDFQGKPLYTIRMVEDISQEKESEEKLQESEERLRYLTSQLMTAQEDERKRISRELHDELGQALLVLKLQTRSIEGELLPEQQQLRGECLEMLGNLDQVVDNVRRLSRDLSPLLLEDLGLTAALRHLVTEFGKHYKIKYTAQETNIDDLFPHAAQVAIYRIVQESLTNIGKHSQAKLLLISVTKHDNRVAFVIQDDGKGFDPEQLRRQRPGMGLAAMEERARMAGGTLSIWSQADAGTKIFLEIPYSNKKK